MNQDRRLGDQNVREIEHKLSLHLSAYDRDVKGEHGLLKRFKPVEETIWVWRGGIIVLAFFTLGALASLNSAITRIESNISDIRIQAAAASARSDRSEQSDRVYRRQNAGNRGVVTHEEE